MQKTSGVSTHWRLLYALNRLCGVWQSVHAKTNDKIKIKKRESPSFFRKMYEHHTIESRLRELCTDIILECLPLYQQLLFDSDSDEMAENTLVDETNKIECSSFGWIRLEITDKHKMRIPLCLKKLCTRR